MTDAVNPELETADQDLRLAVRALFGIRSRGNQVSRRAVNDFLKHPHRKALDDANLRVIAAAAPMLNVDQVANLIRNLPFTNMDLAIKAPDLDQLRLDFRLILTEVPQDRRQVVMADLIHDSTVRMLRLCSPKHLSKQAQTIVSSRAHETIRTGVWTEVESLLKPEKDASVNDADPPLLMRRFGHQELVKYFIAGHPTTSPQILVKFIAEEPDFRGTAIQNPAATLQMLEAGARDHDAS